MEGVCMLCLDGLDLFTRAADTRESSAKYLEYMLDSPTSKDLPSKELGYHFIACWGVPAFQMLNTRRLCITSPQAEL